MRMFDTIRESAKNLAGGKGERSILSLKKELGTAGDTYVVDEPIDLGDLLEVDQKTSVRLILKKGDRMKIADKADTPQGEDNYEAFNHPGGVPKMVRISVFNDAHPDVGQIFYATESALKGKKIKVNKAGK